MGKIRETSHTVDREMSGSDLVAAVGSVGLSTLLGNTGKVYNHNVTVRDNDGCVGSGSGATYEVASARALQALAHEHDDD